MATKLLNDDGTASMATLLMCSHHAFRRDVASFARALAEGRLGALAEEWNLFRSALHGHHTAEETAVFPDLRARQPQLAGAIEELDAHHRAIDPLLARGDDLFAQLANRHAIASDLIATLAQLLTVHLDAEERSIICHLRDAKRFPLPPNEDALAIYADGFAWASAGISDAVLDRVFEMLPGPLAAKIPEARAVFDERSRRVWGYVHQGASVTSLPVR